MSGTSDSDTPSNPERTGTITSRTSGKPVHRIKSQDLFQQRHEIEIDHEGRIYRLRLTQHNKLILTA